MANAMPVEADLYRFLLGAGMVETSADTANLDLGSTLADAIADFERETHWEPFVSTGSDVTLKFSPTDILYPPNELPMMDLGGGVLSVTSLTVGVTPTSTGTVLVLDTDFFLKPSNAPTKGKPYTYIEFYRANFAAYGYLGGSFPNSIRLVGKAGYSLTCPENAFRAVLCRAGCLLSPQIEAALTGGEISWKDGMGSGQFSAAPFLKQAEQWADKYAHTVTMYRRVI